VIRNGDSITIRKNRKRALWSLIIVGFMIPVSGWLLYAGLQPGRPEVAWALVLLGASGVIAFAWSAAAIIRTMRSPWNVSVSPVELTLRTPAYELKVPWQHVAAIAVDVVNRRPGCTLIFDDLTAVSRGATFHTPPNHPDAVMDAAMMRSRLEENFRQGGYHLGIPGRILEAGPDELAELLARARTGRLWEGGGIDHETALDTA
jgi:hypothetical protein